MSVKTAERILGILSISLFSLGLLFKYQLWPGAGVLVMTSLPLFVLGYLPLHLIYQSRIAGSKLMRGFLILKVVTLFFIMCGIVLNIQHLPGGSELIWLGLGLAAILIIFHFYLRVRGKRRPSTILNDMVFAVLAFGIFIYTSNPRESIDTLDRYMLFIDLYERQNAGIASANRILYNSIDSMQIDDASTLESINMSRLLSNQFHRAFDSLTDGFVRLCNTDRLAGRKDSPLTLDPIVLTNTFYGGAYYIKQGNGALLRTIVEAYLVKTAEITRRHNLPAHLVGLGLEFNDMLDEGGVSRPWETYFFEDLSVSDALQNLLWIKQMILLTENSVINGLINQVDLSDEVRLLREMAAQESEQAMAMKENEILRVRQQQSIQELELEQHKAELEQRNLVILFAIIGVVFVLVLLFISTRAFYLKRRDNKRLADHEKEITQMNQELNQQYEEIAAQRDEIEAQRDTVFRQKEEIEKTHGEISSSIDYAQKLQTAILPSPGLLRTRIDDHFVLFSPKHRVSGDFYWWTQIEDQVVITAADCTGHGVPGAFMSMLGISMLREIVNKEYISHPGVILRRLRKEVIHALKQTGEFGEQKDGMDMALVSINVETLECQYAGANNPLYLVRDGELTEYKADRMPIAIHQDMGRFTTHDIQLRKGDQLYMSSDGYVDQFGGPENKKFKYKAFRQMLVDHSGKSMKEQNKAFTTTLIEWMGDLEQVDDIVVVGLKV